MRKIATLLIASLCGAGCATPPDAEPVASAPESQPAAAPHPETHPEESTAETTGTPAITEPVHQNTLKWSTASEVDNFGYDIYRALSEDGPFERINPDPLAGAGTTDERSDYLYLDTAIDPHTNYYYFVESISLQGVRERFTPIINAPAKIAPPTETPIDSSTATPSAPR
jgi:hypothetical protein